MQAGSRRLSARTTVSSNDLSSTRSRPTRPRHTSTSSSRSGGADTPAPAEAVHTYRIVYRVMGNEVWVLAIVDGRRDLDTLLYERARR